MAVVAAAFVGGGVGTVTFIFLHVSMEMTQEAETAEVWAALVDLVRLPLARKGTVAPVATGAAAVGSTAQNR